MIATVYLPVDAKHYEFNFTLEINRLKLVLKDYIKTHDVYVVGDFNTEFTRQRSSNTTSLRKLMREFGLTAGDMDGRLFNFTYYKGDKTSHLDHILHARMNPRVENIEIVRDEDNNSDHLAIELTIETRVDLKKNNKTTKMVNPKPQWKNNQFLERYNFVLDAEKHEICDCMTELKYAIENKEHVDDLHAKLHKKLHELLRKATEEALKLCCNKSFKDKNKRKNWYSKEIIELNKIVTKTRREFESNPNMHTKLAVKGISKVLRREVRNSKTAARRRETNDLDSLRTNNIDRFWRRVKEKLTTKTTVEAGISELKDDFENLFTSKIASESEEAKNAKIEIDNFRSSSLGTVYKYNLRIETVKEVIGTLEGGKAVGPLKVSNEMFKYCKCEDVFEAMRLLMETTFTHGTVPVGSNQAIIKPLVKDQNKSSSDLGNIRPISVSDTYSTIFEKILLLETDKVHVNSKKQFGFKAKSSCNHAAYLLFEAAKHSTLKT